MYERRFPRFGGREYVTTIFNFFSLPDLFLRTLFWFKDIFLEFALVFKGLHVDRVVSNVEKELLCFALVVKFLL